MKKYTVENGGVNNIGEKYATVMEVARDNIGEKYIMEKGYSRELVTDWLLGGISMREEDGLGGPVCLEYRKWKVILCYITILLLIY